MKKTIFRLPNWFTIVSYIFMLGFALFCVIPFWMLVAGSITNERDLVLNGYRLWPERFSFEAYKTLLDSQQIARSYLITIAITLTGTCIGVLITSSFAYTISAKRNPYRNLLAFYVYFTMLFNGGLVPFYLLVSRWLSLSNTLWAIILPLAVNPFLVFLMVNFFRTIPEEMLESGRIDGASEWVIFFKLVLPVSVPSIATVSLFLILAYWNDWFMSMLFISDSKMFPLQLLLRRILDNIEAAKVLVRFVPGVQVPAFSLRMAATVLTIGPIVLVYPFVQRYFIKGLTMGAIKG